MKFFAKNPGGTEFQFSAIDWEAEFPKITTRMEHRKLDVTTLEKVPVLQGAIIRAEDGGRTRFRGYVEFEPEVDGTKKKLLCVGDEKRLNECVLPMYFYTSGNTTIGEVFNDEPADVPGLFTILNGALPAGWEYTIYDAAKNIIKLSGMGTLSRWANPSLISLGYLEAINLERVPALSDLQLVDNASFQDATDLYVRVSTAQFESGWYKYGGLLFLNGFDTGCRVGTVDNSESALLGDLEINDDTRGGDLIVGLARGHGLHTHVRSDSDNTYIHLLEDEGEGYPDGLFELHQARCKSLKRKAARERKVASLTGRGEGYEFHTVPDVTWQGPWLSDIYDVAHGFSDSDGKLQSYTEAEFDLRQIDHQWEATTYDKLNLHPGDLIKVVPLKYLPEVLSCDNIKLNADGETIVVLGPAQAEYSDTWEALQEIQGFTDKTVWPSNVSITQQSTLYPEDPDHAGSQASLSFTVKDKVKDSAINPRITLDISLSYNTDKIPIPQRCVMIVLVNDVRQPPIGPFTIGSTLKSMDITTNVTQNTTNTVKVNVYFATECDGSHSDNTGHPLLSVSATMNFWKRMKLA